MREAPFCQHCAIYLLRCNNTCISLSFFTFPIPSHPPKFRFLTNSFTIAYVFIFWYTGLANCQEDSERCQWDTSSFPCFCCGSKIHQGHSGCEDFQDGIYWLVGTQMHLLTEGKLAWIWEIQDEENKFHSWILFNLSFAAFYLYVIRKSTMV